MRMILNAKIVMLLVTGYCFNTFFPTALADDKPVRARGLGIPFDGTPGHFNAITDVPGVTVGETTIIADLPDGKAVRTGVTAILPRGTETHDKPVFGGYFSLNGNGEMTGTAWLEESGMLEGPILITNTHSVGTVRDASIAWRVAAGAADASGYWWSLPVVAETWDGWLNDINGFHVKAEHVTEALNGAASGPVGEGNVGGGTGMICHQFKCGTGTSSRIIEMNDGPYSVGVLVQANYGTRDTLRVAGVPVGKHLQEDKAYSENNTRFTETGSIIIVVATNAPLLPHQLKRLSRRAALGLARNGSYAGNGSGDIFVAFSTANQNALQSGPKTAITMITNDEMDPLFLAVVEATEEAIINALVAGRDMTGNMGHTAKAISHKALQDIMRQYNRLNK
ncbi:DmpA family aminopeptidase [Kordiimonas pumila]|uniref:P1 family peptidase n=1 Tax=Kordiimonas pumila TaxID=2161677 RepID=A0ABV7D0R7_9PROT|nr:P1 family peptidase [Kordiimonas pumila]